MTTTETAFARRLAVSDKLSHLVLPPRMTAMVNTFVEGVGRIDLARLSEAVSLAAQACPGMRLALTPEEPVWRDTGVAPQVRVVNAASFTLDAPWVSEGLVTEGGPTSEVVLIDGPDPTVLFRAHHAVADGIGVRTWILDVFRALRGESPVGADDARNIDELVAELPVPDGEPEPLEPEPSLLPRPAEFTERRHFWRRRTVPGNHPAAVAKVAAALTAFGGVEQGVFWVPVDLRRHVPGLRSTANLVRIVPLRTWWGESWEQVQDRLLATLSDNCELLQQLDFDDLAAAPLAAVLEFFDSNEQEAVRITADRYGGSAAVSHVGRYTTAEVSTESFEATTVYGLPSQGYAGFPLFDITEFDGRTEIVATWYDGPGLTDRVDSLLDAIAEALAPAAFRQWPGNNTQRDLPASPTLTTLFAEQVARTPDAVALDGPQGPMTYAELDRQAASVAAVLLAGGVRPDTVVGIVADRTPSTIAAIWGVLKAGAAFLPLDPRHPDSRLHELLVDADARFCLASQGNADRVAGFDVVVLDSVPDAPAPPDSVEPGDLAYLIYTSGSTGRPKGVQIEHRGIVNYSLWAARAYGFDHTIRIPLIAPMSFDWMCNTLFPPLLAGATVVLVPEEPDHVVLRRMLTESGANAASLTPVHLDLLSTMDVKPSGYKFVVSCGEALSVDLAARVQELFGCRVINAYGPTEATVACTAAVYRGETGPGNLTIGVPGDNTQVFLLDGHRRHVAPGDIGEIFLAGTQLARGYHRRPDLTRDRFVCLADGTRAYRTGDLGRLRPDGTLECLGRVDRQIKVNGFRVEPDEVARALERHPGVRAAVVTGVRRGRGQVLCGYAVAEADPVLLREFLAGLLPAHMVPAVITVLPELPVSRNGKVDVGALPDPFASERVKGGGEAVAVGDTAAVAGIWARVLDLDPSAIAGDSDFTQLGGTSVAMIQMVAAVCAEVVGPAGEPAFMRRLPEIIAAPTLAAVCALAEETR
ncbi:non-ribosomal peptide synthetase [Kutzneria sp. CA-103260]|uniref:non-ribosomal peptide synthetase n=1 Tax=Kutzneria sp. CA-103260 TaxID=2802641 RepID=UPI001BA9F721|nr:non-ribosomal peptide synthetase [Kutzneria sp. CA-103260]QUQ63039.1 D-alanine--D-alanyl carrier protein ligase [Kutzneria sp. CA-103260]